MLSFWSVGADDEARTRYLHLGKVALYQMSYIRRYGAFGRNRTTDTGIFSPLLYRLSYKGKWRPGSGSNRRPLAWQASVLTNWTTGPNGGNNRARTCDPLLVRQVLSQLSYAPICLGLSSGVLASDRYYIITTPSECQHFFWIFFKKIFKSLKKLYFMRFSGIIFFEFFSKIFWNFQMNSPVSYFKILKTNIIILILKTTPEN